MAAIVGGILPDRHVHDALATRAAALVDTGDELCDEAAIGTAPDITCRAKLPRWPAMPGTRRGRALPPLELPQARLSPTDGDALRAAMVSLEFPYVFRATKPRCIVPVCP